MGRRKKGKSVFQKNMRKFFFKVGSNASKILSDICKMTQKIYSMTPSPLSILEPEAKLKLPDNLSIPIINIYFSDWAQIRINFSF